DPTRVLAGPRAGAVFAGRYQILGIVGKGGMGTVYRALDRELDDEVALKVLLPDAFEEGATLGLTLKQEIRLARKITHPNVVRTHDLGEADGLRFLTMEYVPGTTLRDIIDKKGAVALAPGLQIAKQLCRGLAAVHEAGIIHRDIKPLNIMVLPNGVVKLMDFGIARAAEGADPAAPGGITVGTPTYMSPEQASGADEVDHRSDIYSLGIVLWQMLAGDPPFEAGGSQAVIMQQVSRDVPPVKTRRPDVNPALAAVVARCTRKAREERYQSAEEVAHALRAAGGGMIAAAPRPLRAWLMGTAALVLLVLAGVLGRSLGRSGAGSAAAGSGARTAADSTAAGPRGAAPAIAVLPFSAVTSGDTAQFGRSAALMLAEALALRNGVTTVDGNSLLARWINERRRLIAPLDSNARFAYSLGANQMVMGNYVESGRTFRLALALYDTHDASRLWTDEVTGSTDSLFALIDRIAGRVATALCSQPDYNPGSVCYDTPARPRAPLAVTGTGADTAPVAVFARVAATGDVSDVRVTGSSADPYATSQALRAIQSTRLDPARKSGRPVAAWTTVSVAVRPASGAVATTTTCATSAYGVRNPNGECFDARPVPQRAPVAVWPATCQRSPRPVTVLVHVTSAGAVDGAASITQRSDCAGFDTAAAAAASQLAFEPARKAGQPVDAWVQVLVRAGPPAASGGR
ncbi:MAG: TonB family protein, partial [Gemmatimonadales bacterium]